MTPAASPARLLAVVLLAAGTWQAGSGLYLHAKARLAQVLIEHAWQRKLQHGGATARPWAWADTTAVARLRFVEHGRSMIVLEGESGRTLAFGPGHRSSTPLPGEAGNSVVSGHRDTHFRILEHLSAGQHIEVERPDGGSRSYRVSGVRIVDHRDLAVLADRGRDALTLVTCWPFDAVAPGGPLRYVVSALAEDGA